MKGGKCLVHVIWTERWMLKLVLNVKYLLLLSFLTAAKLYNLGQIQGVVRVNSTLVIDFFFFFFFWFSSFSYNILYTNYLGEWISLLGWNVGSKMAIYIHWICRNSFGVLHFDINCLSKQNLDWNSYLVWCCYCFYPNSCISDSWISCLVGSKQ